MYSLSIKSATISERRAVRVSVTPASCIEVMTSGRIDRPGLEQSKQSIPKLKSEIDDRKLVTASVTSEPLVGKGIVANQQLKLKISRRGKFNRFDSFIVAKRLALILVFEIADVISISLCMVNGESSPSSTESRRESFILTGSTCVPMFITLLKTCGSPVACNAEVGGITVSRFSMRASERENSKFRSAAWIQLSAAERDVTENPADGNFNVPGTPDHERVMGRISNSLILEEPSSCVEKY